MKFTYTPEGAEPRTWNFKARDLMSPEATAIEKATGMDFDDAISRFENGNIGCIRAVLWVLLKRQTPTLKLADVVFRVSEVAFEPDEEEARALITQVESMIANGEELTPAQQAAYDELLAEYPPLVDESGDEAEVVDGPGKATPPAETTTGGSSPISSESALPNSTV